LRYDVDGAVVMKSYLHGTPRIDMALNRDFMFVADEVDKSGGSGTSTTGMNHHSQTLSFLSSSSTLVNPRVYDMNFHSAISTTQVIVDFT
jgi:hypothetical protein